MIESLGDVASSLAALGFGPQSSVLCAGKALHYSAQSLFDAGNGDLVVAVVVGKLESTNGLLLFGGPPRSVAVGPSLMANMSTSVRMMLSSLRAIASSPELAGPAPAALDSFPRRVEPPSPRRPPVPAASSSLLPPAGGDCVSNDEGAHESPPASPGPGARSTSQRNPPPRTSLSGPVPFRTPLPLASSSLGATAATLSRSLVAGTVRGGSAEPPRPLNVAPGTETGDEERLEQLQQHIVLETVPGLLEIPDMIGSAAEEAKLRVGALETIDIPDDIASSVLRQMRTYYQSDKSMLRQWAQLLKHACTMLIAKKTAAGKKPVTIGSYRAMTPKACVNAVVKLKDGVYPRMVERPMLHKTSHIDEKTYLAVVLVMAFQEQSFYLWLIAQFSHGAICLAARKRKRPLQGDNAGEDSADGNTMLGSDVHVGIGGGEGGRGRAAAGASPSSNRAARGRTATSGGEPVGGDAVPRAPPVRRPAGGSAGGTTNGGDSQPAIRSAAGGGRSSGGRPPAGAVGGGAAIVRGQLAATARVGLSTGGGQSVGTARGGASSTGSGPSDRASVGSAACLGVHRGGAVAGGTTERASACGAPEVFPRRSCAGLVQGRCEESAVYDIPRLELLLRDGRKVAVGVCEPLETSVPGGSLIEENVAVRGGAQVVSGCTGLAYPGDVGDLQAVCESPFTWALSCIG